MKNILSGFVASAFLCAAAMSAHAELLTWHAQGTLSGVKPFDYSADPGGDLGARLFVANTFSGEQHVTFDYVIDNGVVGVQSGTNNDGLATSFTGALLSLDVHVVESNFDYQLSPSQGAVTITAQQNEARQFTGLTFRAQTGNGLMLRSNFRPAVPAFYLITGDHGLPVDPVNLDPFNPVGGLARLGDIMAHAPASQFEPTVVMLGLAQECHPVSYYCAIGTLKLNSFSVSALPEPGSMALTGLGLAFMGFAARRRQAAGVAEQAKR